MSDRYLEPNLDQTLILEMVLCLFAAYYIAQELSELTISRSEYLADGWNILDWANLLLLLAVTMLRLLSFSAAGALIIINVPLLSLLVDDFFVEK